MERIKVKDCFKRKYIIPCFQREYAWEEEEIEELIKSIRNLNKDYCLGITVAKKENQNYKLIDGQQRITTLYMIAMCVNYIKTKEEINLSSEYNIIFDDKNNLVELLNDNEENVSRKLYDGWQLINKLITEEEKEKFREIIDNYLYYYEIDLDISGNDLNHYFEVMNSRGVQLSKSDIVKFYIMRRLSSDNDKEKLNYLWYKYEKMDDDASQISCFSKIKDNFKTKYRTINDIINSPDFDNDKNEEKTLEDYNSILTFEYFLLYVIRLYKHRDEINYEKLNSDFNLDELIVEYEEMFNGDISNDEVIEFLDYLIKMKRIYDKYIVKYIKSIDGWRLDGEREKMIPIQSCMRVSFTSRASMHWIYITLKYFDNENDIDEYIRIMEKFIRKEYVYDYIHSNEEIDYRTGFNTPIIVLNYLDYVMKKKYKDIVNDMPELKELVIKDFSFKFRNSIEHFMPRHDKDGNPNPDWVNDFGNLALLAYGTNTKMQNAEPDEKAKHFDKALSGYSLKLQIMTVIAKTRGWNEKESIYLTKKCINVLKDDLNS